MQGERIASVGSGAPPRNDGWNYVDMSGRYALPGFFDTHAHVTIGPLKVEVKDGAPTFRFEVIHDLHRHNALIALAFGVTTIRNPAGDAEANAHYDAMIAERRVARPRSRARRRSLEPCASRTTRATTPSGTARWRDSKSSA